MHSCGSLDELRNEGDKVYEDEKVPAPFLGRISFSELPGQDETGKSNKSTATTGNVLPMKTDLSRCWPCFYYPLGVPVRIKDREKMQPHLTQTIHSSHFASLTLTVFYAILSFNQARRS